MNGYRVLGRTKGNARTRHLPVTMVSALRATDRMVRRSQLAAHVYLKKPLNPVVLKVWVTASL